MSLRALFVALTLAVLTPAGGAGAGQPEPRPAAAPLTLERVEIVAANGRRHAFRVEVADDPAERERGLMFRTAMPADQGMLFDFKQAQPVAFWMENTYIPLDLIFIRADGRIARITANATPFSRALLPSGEPVLAVLEINAGLSARLGLQPGDTVRHRIFKNVRTNRR